MERIVSWWSLKFEKLLQNLTNISALMLAIKRVTVIFSLKALIIAIYERLEGVNHIIEGPSNRAKIRLEPWFGRQR